MTHPTGYVFQVISELDDHLLLVQVLEQVGADGRHQRLLVWLFVVPLNFLIPFIALAPIFFSSVPSHHCKAPPLSPEEDTNITSTLETYGNSSDQIWSTLAIPRY